MVGTNSHIAKLKAQLDRAITQREHWKQLAENRNSIVVTEVCPESRSVEEYVIDADSVRASWRLIRGYREQSEALRAENERLADALDRQSVITGDYIARCQRLADELEAIKGQEAVGYFVQPYTDRPQVIERVDDAYAEDEDVFPLYRLPPAKADEVSVSRALLERVLTWPAGDESEACFEELRALLASGKDQPK